MEDIVNISLIFCQPPYFPHSEWFTFPFNTFIYGGHIVSMQIKAESFADSAPEYLENKPETRSALDRD